MCGQPGGTETGYPAARTSGLQPGKTRPAATDKAPPHNETFCPSRADHQPVDVTLTLAGCA
ncbi:MAG TPA: hypothetical protein VIY52_25070 [Streptosporangiaceae bacterium]